VRSPWCWQRAGNARRNGGSGQWGHSTRSNQWRSVGVRLCSWFLDGDEKPKTKSDPPGQSLHRDLSFDFQNLRVNSKCRRLPGASCKLRRSGMQLARQLVFRGFTSVPPGFRNYLALNNFHLLARLGTVVALAWLVNWPRHASVFVLAAPIVTLMTTHAGHGNCRSSRPAE